MQRYAYVVVRKAEMDEDKGLRAEKIVVPEDGVLYYDAEEPRTEMSLLVPLLKELAEKGIGEKNIDEAAVRYPFAQK